MAANNISINKTLAIVKFILPLLKLTVRIGPINTKDPIVRIVDIRAEFTILIKSYVERHYIRIKETKMHFQSFRKGIAGFAQFLGLIKGPIWLAGKLMDLPIYVIDDHFAGQPLLLGINFIIAI